MEQDKLQNLFDNFQPQLATDNTVFISRLERNLRSVELVKQKLKADRKRNRVAAGMASAVGFIFGVASSLLYPTIRSYVKSIFSDFQFPVAIPDYYMDTLTLAILGMSGMLISYTVYDLTRTFRPRPSVNKYY